MTEDLINKKDYKICCIGAGYVGGPTMAVIADNCKSAIINVVDLNKDRINAWNSENFQEIPIFEEGLEEILKKTRNINLFFSTNVFKEIANADIIFICVNTPTKNSGIGAGKASDLKWVEKCARDIAKHSEGHTIVVEKSTVPVKTARVIEEILKLEMKQSKKTFSVLSNPEFLSEGNAIEDLKNPDRILIGGEDDEAIKVLSSIYSSWINKSKLIITNIWSSELSKLTANAFLAQRISSMNAISALCEKTGAVVKDVARAVGTDSRIGREFLASGPGFGGSCFKKDILNLIYLCEYYGLSEASEYWLNVLKINEWQQTRISNVVIDKLFGSVSGKKIAILGFAFKANTNDTRESPAINICNNLIEEGAVLTIHDPRVTEEQIEIEFKNLMKNKNHKTNESKTWKFCKSVDEAIFNSHAVLILTEWKEYGLLDWHKYEKKMIKPSWIFDTRSIINIQRLRDTNLNLWSIGNNIK